MQTAHDDLYEAIKQAGEREFPKEACGLVIDAGGKRPAIIECKNVSREPENSFLMSPSDQRSAMLKGRIVGVWHTHTKSDSSASKADLAMCEASQVPWYIVAVKKHNDVFQHSDVNVVYPSGFEMPYLGRPYIEGVFDCFGLMRDYYRREFGIIVPNFPRVEDDGTLGYTRFLERYSMLGFKKLIDQEPQNGDIFLMQLMEHIPNHIAVYIGDGMILHHNRDRLSKRDVYGGYWHKATCMHLRHEDLFNVD